MADSMKDLGVAMAILERFAAQRLPRALDLKAKVGRGERLSDLDTAHLREMLESADEIKPYVDHRPDYREVYAGAAALHHEITEKALANEKAAGASWGIGHVAFP